MHPQRHHGDRVVAVASMAGRRHSQRANSGGRADAILDDRLVRAAGSGPKKKKARIALRATITAVCPPSFTGESDAAGVDRIDRPAAITDMSSIRGRGTAAPCE